MARGWESKSVELQQEDARSAKEPKRRLSATEKEIEARKETLRLTRSRILEQIQAASNPRYKTLLEQSLTLLDQEIMRVG